MTGTQSLYHSSCPFTALPGTQTGLSVSVLASKEVGGISQENPPESSLQPKNCLTLSQINVTVSLSLFLLKPEENVPVVQLRQEDCKFEMKETKTQKLIIDESMNDDLSMPIAHYSTVFVKM